MLGGGITVSIYVMSHSLSNQQDFQSDLLTWFSSCGRRFPWRKTKNPYKVLVAEKLLQQTRATEQVLLAYNTLISKYPKPFLLAKANLRDIKRIIKPLGLSFRARHLRQMSKELIEKHNGKVPKNYEELLKLTGVGEYCARAVLSFAYRQDYAVIDTNVGRFLFRLFNLQKKFPANPSRKKYLVELAESILPDGKSREFNLAILDLCALICKPQKPDCANCPVQKYCRYEGKYFLSQ